jgi:ankyrin repeat protein
MRNISNISPLWIAAANGHLTAVMLLLDTQAVNIELRSKSRQSPIFSAAADGHEAVVELLLKRGANLWFEDKG